MDLEKAQVIAEKIKDTLSPVCTRIEIAGSIRRRRPFVHDIDLVAIPANQGQFAYRLQQLGRLKVGGQKLLRVELAEHAGFALDVYVATPQTWATLLLIRTGSKSHNIHLCKLANQKGYKLHADGSGLTQFVDCEGRESRVAGDTEESIFQALELPYKRPEARE